MKKNKKMGYGRFEERMDGMCSYKHTHNSAVHIINEDGSFSISKSENLGNEQITTSGPMRGSSIYANALVNTRDAIKDILALDFEGDGGTQGGGFFLTTTGNVGSPTKTKSLSDAEQVAADDLISALGGLGGGGINNTSNKTIKLLNQYSNFDSFLNSFNDAVQAIPAAIDEVLGGNKTFETRKVCNQCDNIIDKDKEDSHITLGEGTRDTLIEVKNE